MKRHIGKITIGLLSLCLMGVMLMTPRDYQQGYAYALQILGVPMGGTGLTNLGAKGALLAAADPTTFATVAVGSDGQVLTACSGQTAGVKWAAAGGGGAPGGSSGQIQYNRCGAFTGCLSLTYTNCPCDSCSAAFKFDDTQYCSLFSVSVCNIVLDAATNEGYGCPHSEIYMCPGRIAITTPTDFRVSVCGSSMYLYPCIVQLGTNGSIEISGQNGISMCTGTGGNIGMSVINGSLVLLGGLCGAPGTIQESANVQLQNIGTGTLSSGTATIYSPALTSNSRVLITNTAANVTNVGVPVVTSQTPGTGFVVTSTNPLDSSTFNWMFFCAP